MDFEGITGFFKTKSYAVEPEADMQSVVNAVADEFGGDAQYIQPTTDGETLQVRISASIGSEEVVERMQNCDSIGVVRPD